MIETLMGWDRLAWSNLALILVFLLSFVGMVVYLATLADVTCERIGRAAIKSAGLLALVFPDVLLVGGAGLILSGVYLLFDLAVTLILAGLLAVGCGVAIEIRTIKRGPDR